MNRYPLFFSLSLLAGCASITPAQIGAAHDLADSTRRFAELPAKVVDDAADVRAEREVLRFASATGKTDAPPQTFVRLTDAVKQRDQVREQGQKLKAAARVLAAYANLLARLSSGGPENGLDDDSEAGGAQLDSAIADYNAIARASVPQVRAAAAQARGTAGPFPGGLRAAYVKAYVEACDPVVQAVAATMAQETTGFVELLNADAKAMDDSFTQSCQRSPAGYDEVDGYYHAWAGLQSAKRLAERASKAATALAAAHGKLLEALKTKGAVTQSPEAVEFNRLISD